MHKKFLLAALDQAFLGRGFCAPNPSVGAVAVHNGQIIAQACHRGAGTPHAEQLLLAELPKNITDLTLYVTLEPCNHWGKTPPCVDAIIKYGIKKVVFAYCDPNPIVTTNNTPNLLSMHGIEVLHYPLQEIDEFYQSYNYWTLTKKPWVTAKIAQSLDGKIAGAKNERIKISNELCATFTHQQRLQADVILTTATTVNNDEPLLNARLEGCEYPKTLAIIDSHLTLKQDAEIFNKAKHCHIYYSEHEKNNKIYKNSTSHPINIKSNFLDLEAIICHLGAMGYHDVWVEAGGRLFTVLHTAGLVNRTYIYIAPTILGNEATSLYHDISIFNNPHKLMWRKMDDNMILCIDWILA